MWILPLTSTMEVDSEPNSQPNSTVEATAAHPVHDGRYYFVDGTVVLLVRRSKIISLSTLTHQIQCEAALYKVHKTRLTIKSKVFEEMFEIPQGHETEGHDDEHPIKLPDSNIDFRHLLVFLYDQSVVYCVFYLVLTFNLPEMKSKTRLCNTISQFFTCQKSTGSLRALDMPSRICRHTGISHQLSS